LANKEAERHKTSKKELDNMRALIARDLADAGIASLLCFLPSLTSSGHGDRRFCSLYSDAPKTGHGSSLPQVGC